MVTVPRHPTDNEWAEEQLDEYYSDTVKKSVASVADSPDRLDVISTNALKRLGYTLALDPVAENLATWDSTVEAMQVLTAIFGSANATEGTVEWLIAGQTVEIPATGPVYYANFSRWFEAFWLAVICRDTKRLQLLVDMPLELVQQSGMDHDEFDLKFAQALQKFSRREQGLAEALTEAMAATDQERVREPRLEYALRIAYTTMKALFYLLRSNQEEKFNEALAQALEQHKKYWTADDDKAEHPRGFVALGPLAIACIAKDAGMTITVESEYLPKHLVLGSWVGEYRIS